MKEKQKRISIFSILTCMIACVCSLAFVTKGTGQSVVANAEAQSVSLPYTYSLTTTNSGTLTAVGVYASNVSTTDKNGAAITGVELSSDTVYHDPLMNSNTSNTVNNVKTGEQVFVDGYQMPYSQGLTLKIDDALDLSKGVDFLMSPMVKGQKNTTKEARFVMALSEGNGGSVQGYTTGRKHNGFKTDESYISWEFTKYDRWSGYDGRQQRHGPAFYEGINATAEVLKESTYTKQIANSYLSDAFYGLENYRDNNELNGYDSLVKVHIGTTDTELSVTFTQVFKQDLSIAYAGTPFTRTYSLSDIGFEKTTPVYLYFGYYNQMCRFTTAQGVNAEQQALPMSLGLYNLTNGPTMEAKVNSAEVEAGEISIADFVNTYFDYQANGGDETPEFSVVSDNEKFAKVENGVIKFANVSDGAATITVTVGDLTASVYAYVNKVAPFNATATTVDGLTFAEDKNADAGLHGYRVSGNLTNAEVGDQYSVVLGEIDIHEGFSVILDPTYDKKTSISTANTLSSKRIYVRIGNAKAEHKLNIATRWNGDTSHMRLSENGKGLNEALGITYNLKDISGELAKVLHGDNLLKYEAKLTEDKLTVTLTALDRNLQPIEGAVFSYTSTKVFEGNVQISVHQYLNVAKNENDTNYAIDMGIYNYRVGTKLVSRYVAENISGVGGTSVEVVPAIRYYDGVDANDVALKLVSKDETLVTVNGMNVTFKEGVVGTAVVEVYANEEFVGTFNAAVQLDKLEITNKAALAKLDKNNTYKIALNPAIYEHCTFTSSNEEIATVDANGVITPVSGGTATITVSYANLTDTVEVFCVFPAFTAKANVAEVEAGEISIADFVEEYFDYQANGGNETPEFSVVSDNAKFAKVENGVIKFVNVSDGAATITVTVGDLTASVYAYVNKVAPFNATATTVDGLTFAEDKNADAGLHGYRVSGNLTNAEVGDQYSVVLGEIDIHEGFSVILDPTYDKKTSISTANTLSSKRIVVRIGNAKAEHKLSIATRWNGDTSHMRLSENGKGLNEALGITYNLKDISGELAKVLHGDNLLKYEAKLTEDKLTVTLTALDRNLQPIEGAVFSYTSTKVFEGNVQISVHQYLNVAKNENDTNYAIDMGIYNYRVGTKLVSRYVAENISGVGGTSVEVVPAIRYYDGVDANDVALKLVSKDETVATVNGMNVTFKEGVVGTAVVEVYANEEFVGTFNASIKLEKLEITNKAALAKLDKNNTYKIALNPAINEHCTFTSSNEGIATVDANGVITPVSGGTATITVSYANLTDTVEVFCVFPSFTAKVNAVKVEAGEISVADFVSTYFDYKANGGDETPEFSVVSENAKFSKVENGVIKFVNVSDGAATITVTVGDLTASVYTYASKIAPFDATATTVDGLTFAEDKNADNGLHGYRVSGNLTNADAGAQFDVVLGEMDINEGFSVILDPTYDMKTSISASNTLSSKRIYVRIGNAKAEHRLYMATRFANDKSAIMRIAENGGGLNEALQIGYNLKDLSGELGNVLYGDNLLKYEAKLTEGKLTVTLTALDRNLQPIEGAVFSYTSTKAFEGNVQISVHQSLHAVNDENDTNYAIDMGIYNYRVGTKLVSRYVAENISGVGGTSVEVVPVIRYYDGVDANDVALKLVSKDETVATVNGMNVTFKEGVVGTAVIEVYANEEFVGTFNASIKLEKLEITNKAALATLNKNGSYAIVLNPAINEHCTFVSSNEAVVTVDANGVITPVGVGEATITVSYDNVSDSVSVVCVPTTLTVLGGEEVSVNCGTSKDVTIEMDMPGAAVTVTSSNTDLITIEGGAWVDGKYTFTIVAADETLGTAQVSVVCGNLSATIDVNVKLAALTIENAVSKLYVGETHTVSVTPVWATATYTSSDASVATIDANGLITAVGVGKTIITASFGGAEYSFELEVGMNFDVTNLEVEVEVGKTVTIELVNAEASQVTFISTQPMLFVVDENGVVTGVGVGTADLLVKSGDKTITVTVTVVEAQPEVNNSTNDSSSASDSVQESVGGCGAAISGGIFGVTMLLGAGLLLKKKSKDEN